jgi:hypothetical protein
MDLVPLVSTPDNKLVSLMSNVNNNRSEQVLINAQTGQVPHCPVMRLIRA